MQQAPHPSSLHAVLFSCLIRSLNPKKTTTNHQLSRDQFYSRAKMTDEMGVNELLALLEKDGLTKGHVQGRAAGWVERQVQGSYAAHLAAEAGAVESLRVLLGAGCRADLRDAQGSTPLMWACGEGQERAAGLLLTEGADQWARDG